MPTWNKKRITALVVAIVVAAFAAADMVVPENLVALFAELVGELFPF